jgi:glycosyltransferase involved in cell wall biosynthesis
MKKILWQTKSAVIFNSFRQGKLMNAASGGNTYDFQAAQALASRFDFEMDETAVKKPGEHALHYWMRMLRSPVPNGDVVIKELYAVVFSKQNSYGKTVAMAHHIDDELGKNKLKHRWFFKKLKKKLPVLDLVITVSEFWEEYLRKLGCKKVKIIYNSFDLNEFNITGDQVFQFKKKYGFDDRPVIYIGNAHRLKGANDTYNALKNSGYSLVMTGSKNHETDLPVKFLNLNRSEYLILLKASDVVITMSKVTEGWNRIAHEAMLSRTPVIGSGIGGMRELLEKGGQKIITDFAGLPLAVEDALQNKNKFGEQGYSFASRFDHKYFINEWVSTIQKLLN